MNYFFFRENFEEPLFFISSAISRTSQGLDSIHLTQETLYQTYIDEAIVWKNKMDKNFNYLDVPSSEPDYLNNTKLLYAWDYTTHFEQQYSIFVSFRPRHIKFIRQTVSSRELHLSIIHHSVYKQYITQTWTHTEFSYRFSISRSIK